MEECKQWKQLCDALCDSEGSFPKSEENPDYVNVILARASDLKFFQERLHYKQKV